MRLFAIADTHLSFAPGVDKPMDVFGPEWGDHWQKLKNNWIEKITEEALAEAILFRSAVKEIFNRE